MDMPWAACALGANRPMTMNTTVKTSPYSRHRPSAASPSAALEGSRKPNPNPSAAVKMMDQPLVGKSASVGPVTRARRAPGGESAAAKGRGDQPVGEPLGLVLGDGDRDPAAGEQHDRGHVTGN